MAGDQNYGAGGPFDAQSFRWPAEDTPAPIATPEEVAANIVAEATVVCSCGLPWDQRNDPCFHVLNGNLHACLPITTSLEEVIAAAIAAERAALTDQVGRLREALDLAAAYLDTDDADGAREVIRAALSPTEPEGKT